MEKTIHGSCYREVIDRYSKATDCIDVGEPTIDLLYRKSIKALFSGKDLPKKEITNLMVSTKGRALVLQPIDYYLFRSWEVHKMSTDVPDCLKTAQIWWMNLVSELKNHYIGAQLGLTSRVKISKGDWSECRCLVNIFSLKKKPAIMDFLRNAVILDTRIPIDGLDMTISMSYDFTPLYPTDILVLKKEDFRIPFVIYDKWIFLLGITYHNHWIQNKRYGEKVRETLIGRLISDCIADVSRQEERKRGTSDPGPF